MSVNFEARMAEVKDTVLQGKIPTLSQLAQYQPTLSLAEPADNGIALDMEVAQMSENVLHQQALLKVLSKHFALLGSAINEGKR